MMKNKPYKTVSYIITLRLSFFLIILLWVFGFLSPLIFSSSDGSIILYPLFHKFYSGVCHQLELKSFSSSGYYMHVCARCSCIYIGALISSILSLLYLKQKHIHIKFLYAGSIPLLLDVIFQSMHFVPYIKTSAFFTGLIFGFTVFIFFLSAVENNILLNKTKVSI